MYKFRIGLQQPLLTLLPTTYVKKYVTKYIIPFLVVTIYLLRHFRKFMFYHKICHIL